MNNEQNAQVCDATDVHKNFRVRLQKQLTKQGTKHADKI